MNKIGVIGDYDSICGFSSVGLNIFPAESAEQGKRLLKLLADGDYGIIYITEPLMEKVKYECMRYDSKPVPCIIPIPACTGSSGFGINRLKACVKQAVGSDIIFNSDE